MQSIRNKKRLTNVVIVFMLTFVVGVAFALEPGTLDVQGTIGMRNHEINIIWSAVDTPLAPNIASTHTANIVDGTSGRSQQGIAWEIGFIGEGVVRLEAWALNAGQVPVEITSPDFNWLPEQPGHVIAGLSAEVFTTVAANPDFTGILAPGESRRLVIEVRWSGYSGWMSGAAFADYEPAAAFFVNIVYTPI